jgi:hypothetical protein
MKWSSAALLAALTGCTSWRVVEAPAPAQLVTAERPTRMLVTRKDGSVVVLSRPDVRGDTLIGHQPAGLTLSDTAREIPVPLSDVRSVAVRRHSTVKTLELVGGILVGCTVLAGIGGAGSWSN